MCSTNRWRTLMACVVVIGIQAMLAEAQPKRKDALEATKKLDLSHTDFERQFTPIPAWHAYWGGKNLDKWHDVHAELCTWLCRKAGIDEKKRADLLDLETISVGPFIGNQYSGRGTVVSFDAKEDPLLSEGSSRFFRIQSAGAVLMHIRGLVRVSGEQGGADNSIESIRVSYRFSDGQWLETTFSRESMQSR